MLKKFIININTSFESLHGAFTSSVRWPYFFPELFDDCEKFSVFTLWSLGSIWPLCIQETLKELFFF